MALSEVRPCRLCGGTPSIQNTHGRLWAVTCIGIGHEISVEAVGKRAAVAMWNESMFAAPPDGTTYEVPKP